MRDEKRYIYEQLQDPKKRSQILMKEDRGEPQYSF